MDPDEAEMIEPDDLDEGLPPDDEVEETPVQEMIEVQGIPITIEYHEGDFKPDPDSDAGWIMKADYGYLDDTIGGDGEETDCFVGPDRSSDLVFIATICDDDGCLDEPKVLLGFGSADDAQKMLDDQYGDRVMDFMQSSIADLYQDISLQKAKAQKGPEGMALPEDPATDAPDENVGDDGEMVELIELEPMEKDWSNEARASAAAARGKMQEHMDIAKDHRWNRRDVQANDHERLAGMYRQAMMAPSQMHRVQLMRQAKQEEMRVLSSGMSLHKSWSDEARKAALAAKGEKYAHGDHQEMHDRANHIGKLVKRDYGHDDGSDLAYNHMQMGSITRKHSDKDAARYVAQLIEQP